jgi:hypothetical protein
MTSFNGSMRSRRLHPVRMVRILLACAVLWLGTGSPARADAWRETVAAVAHVQVSAANVQDGVAAERPKLGSRPARKPCRPPFTASPATTERAPLLHPNRRVYCAIAFSSAGDRAFPLDHATSTGEFHVDETDARASRARFGACFGP